MRPAILLLLLGASAAAHAADREFDALVRNLESHLGVRKTHVPLMGVVNFFVKVGRPGGASSLRLAVFEDLPAPVLTAGEDLDAAVRGAGGERWRPFVRVTSRKNREASYIYSNIDGSKWNLLIATREPREATVVEIKLNTNGLKRWLGDPIRMGRSRHSGDR